MFIIAGMTAMTLAGCQQQDEVSETPAPEPTFVLADLALSLPAASASGTRMDMGVVQDNAVSTRFRGIQSLSILPFTKEGVITIEDKPSIAIPGAVDQDFTQDYSDPFRHYEKYYLNRGVASFLTYGQASRTEPDNTSGVDDRMYYGSLLANVSSNMASGITFELEPIYTGTSVPDKAVAIAAYLTYIAGAETTLSNGRPASWKESSDLKTLYQNFTNQQNGEAYLIAGSSINVKAYVNDLYQKLRSKINDYSEGSAAKAIVEEIKNRIFNYDKLAQNGLKVKYTGDPSVWEDNLKVTELEGCEGYPTDLRLPDGAAVLGWDGQDEQNQRFVPQTNASTMSAIDRYAYPAELYYYGNSRINASKKEVDLDVLKNELQEKTWSQVVNDTELFPDVDAVVSPETKAVVIKDPLQYAVARLDATIASDGSTLNDAGEDAAQKHVDVSKLKITGIILSAQNPVGFDFKPETADDGEDRERFIYDSYLKTADNHDLYLSETPVPIHTLVLQSKEKENVKVILELENEDEDFLGLNKGVVYKGTKFYLVGEIKLSNGSDSGVEGSTDVKADVRKRVFTQDYTTKVQMKVSSLAKAYNVMPNVLTDRLQVSVDIILDWTQNTPTMIEFED